MWHGWKCWKRNPIVHFLIFERNWGFRCLNMWTRGGNWPKVAKWTDLTEHRSCLYDLVLTVCVISPCAVWYHCHNRVLIREKTSVIELWLPAHSLRLEKASQGKLRSGMSSQNHDCGWNDLKTGEVEKVKVGGVRYAKIGSVFSPMVKFLQTTTCVQTHKKSMWKGEGKEGAYETE